MHILPMMAAMLAVLLSVSPGLAAPAGGHQEEGGFLVARNDKGPGDQGAGREDKGGHEKKAKKKDLDQAAMNQVRNAYKFIEQGKPQKAIEELEKAHRMAPDNYWVNYYSAGAWHQLRDYARAHRFWEHAEEAAETPAERSRVRTARAYTEYQSGQAEQARVSLKLAVEIDGGNLRARELLAQVSTPAKPGQPSAGVAIRLGEESSFSGYFKIPMP